MTTLLDLAVPRTLDTLVERFGNGHRGFAIEAWLFEGPASRREAEARLSTAGVTARIRSAYKPLVHHFLEEAPETNRHLSVELPAHEAAPEGRFKLEAYPLAALIGKTTLSFASGSEALAYRVRSGEGAWTSVFAPNRVGPDHLGNQTLTPCGWLRVRDAAGKTVEDGPIETEYETVFRRVMTAIAEHRWPSAPPFFPALDISATLPGIETELAYGDEVLSTSEALHEEFYFSILEYLKHRAGLAANERTLQPGQIVPDIVTADGPARVTVAVRASVERKPLSGPEHWEDADRPLAPAQIAALTDALGGEKRDIASVQGRSVLARIYDGEGPAFLLSAAQHANETSGIVGALRAAQTLRAEGRRFALIPCENPDGYALHHQLRARNPRHMHHAARYSALGDDVEAREAAPFHEKAARLDLIEAVGARMHLNLHGYPAHEWTRPLTGYVPAGFALWTIPKGMFLIFRHHPGIGDKARPFLEALTAHLAEDAELAAFNATQIATWKAHAGEVPFPVINGIPCMVNEHTRQTVPFQLITEYPDETIYGSAFRLAHTTQMRATLEAVRLLREGYL
ncbi:MAG: hypothetical protein FJX54_23760 [Alphaproteobacteria bacterium]|nr:hypothetical protein [Alphaproteobacteria bacterium]